MNRIRQGVFRPLHHVSPVGNPRRFRVRCTLQQQQVSKRVEVSEASILTEWIREEGGFIHDSLCVVDVAPCGARGVISMRAVDVEEEGLLGLVCVPERLYMTSSSARALCLEQTPAQQRRKSESILQQLEDPAQLALLLAHERKKSTHSFFHPYINALPSNPPCAWCMSDSELFSSVALLKRQGVATDDWLTEIAGHKASMMHLAEASVRGFGSALQVDVADVFWALGQVMSRAYGRSPDLGLAPYIDMINHKQGAAKPSGEEIDEEGFACVSPCTNGKASVIEAGDELYISYISSQCLASRAFHNFGFVPPELRP